VFVDRSIGCALFIKAQPDQKRCLNRGREESDCVDRREAGRSSLFKKRPQSIGVSVNETIPETRIAALNVTANS
jgi:hypothetical protein